MARRNFGEVEVAVRKGQKARLGLAGVSGAGKTMTALKVAKTLTRDGKVLVIDTENNSASLYADQLDGWSFSVFNWKPPFDPRELSEALKQWETEFDCLIIDSFSAFYNDAGGLLEIVNVAGKGNQYSGWKIGSPIQAELVGTILRLDAHIIANMRAKQETSLEKDAKTGRNKVVKHGLSAVQRDGFIYNLTLAGMIELESHVLQIEKSRCAELADRVFQPNSGTVEFATILRDWLDGAEAETADREMTEAIEDALDKSVQEAAAQERAEAIVHEEEADALIGMFNHISNDADRTQAKTDFANKFGNPKQLKVVDLERATKFIEDLIAVDA